MVRYYLFLILFLTSCAEVIPLTGGEKDEFAPKPLADKQSPEQGALGYFGQELTVTFDEYFKLQDPSSSITMNPRAGTITTEQKKKTLTLKWDEALQPNTTYIIQLNGTVRDINESNDSIMQFVFSTGLTIDSLQLKGLAINAFNSSPINNATICLFSPESDPFTSSPIYATRSNQKGEYQFSYLKPGKFQLFAFNDQNKNLLIDKTEIIGFESENVTSGDTSSHILRMYQPLIAGEKLQVKMMQPGLAAVSGRTIDPLELKINGNNITQFTSIRSDSLLVALPIEENGSYAFTYKEDTLIRNLQKKDRNASFGIKSLNKGNWRSIDTLTFSFNEWLTAVDTSKIKLKDASNLSVPYQIIQKETTIEMLIKGTVRNKFNIQFDKGALRGNAAVSDSVSYAFRAFMEDDLSILKLNTEVLEGTFLIQLMEGEQVVMEQLKTASTSKVTFNNVIPGNYSLRCIKDDNQNGKWDVGNFETKTQAEELFRFQLKQKLRANWEIEETLQMD